MKKCAIIIEDDEDGAFCVHVPSLPGCHTQRNTRKEAMKNAKEAIQCYLESLEKDALAAKSILKVDVT